MIKECFECSDCSFNDILLIINISQKAKRFSDILVVKL
jgi:hypothetical protein